jgi:hypothetical protein
MLWQNARETQVRWKNQEGNLFMFSKYVMAVSGLFHGIYYTTNDLL